MENQGPRRGRAHRLRNSTTFVRVRSAARSISAWTLLCLSVSAAGEGMKPGFHVTVGRVVLESESPGDSSGFEEYYVRIDRNDPALEADHRAAVGRHELLEGELKQTELHIAKLEADSTQDSTTLDKDEVERLRASSRQHLADLKGQFLAAEKRVMELARMLTGRTSTVSTNKRRVHFGDENVGNLRVHEGDSITIVFMESDVFDDDLLGRKTIIVDEAMLNTGRIELDTGWVESLHLGFVPAD